MVDVAHNTGASPARAGTAGTGSEDGGFAGQLSHVPVPRLLYRLISAQETGELVLRHVELTVRVYFVNGNTVFLSCNYPLNRVGQVLRRHNDISDAQLLEVIELQAQTGQSFPALFLSRGMVDPATLLARMREQAYLRIRMVSAWTGGRFRFVPDIAAPDKMVSLGLDPYHLLADGVRESYDIDRLRRLFAPYADREVAVIANPLFDRARLGLNQAEQRALSFIKPGMSIKAIVDAFIQNRVEPLVGLRAVYLLLQTDFATLDGFTRADEKTGVGPRVKTSPSSAAAPANTPPTTSATGAAASQPAATSATDAAGPTLILSPDDLAPPTAEPTPHGPSFTDTAAPGSPGDQAEEGLIDARPSTNTRLRELRQDEIGPLSYYEETTTEVSPDLFVPEELVMLVDTLRDQNLFERLGLTADSTDADVAKSFFALARKYHPDTAANRQGERKIKEEILALVGEAHKSLDTAEKRANYQASLAMGGGTSPDGETDVSNIMRAEGFFSRGKGLLLHGQIVKAEEFLVEAIALNHEPEYEAYLSYVRHLRSPNDAEMRDAALRIIHDALKDNPDPDVTLVLFEGRIHRTSGNFDAAIGSFNNALDLDPNNVEARRELRLLANRKGSAAAGTAPNEPPARRPSLFRKN
jgi:tetratricopeptide (TPR) repeat protein